MNFPNYFKFEPKFGVQEDVEFMGVKALKFAVPKEALTAATEYNLGFCKEIQRGVIEAKEDSNIRSGEDLEYHVVDWDSCVEYVSFKENPEDSTINITKCKEQKGYDWSHDCKDGIQDISKCMEGNNWYFI